jgi:hypothetical protein
MSKIDDGGPAYPVSIGTQHDQYMAANGMSIRDWFAGQALAGLAQTYSAASFRDKWELHYTDVATHAYDFADAMLAARETEGGA